MQCSQGVIQDEKLFQIHNKNRNTFEAEKTEYLSFERKGETEFTSQTAEEILSTRTRINQQTKHKSLYLQQTTLPAAVSK